MASINLGLVAGTFWKAIRRSAIDPSQRFHVDAVFSIHIEQFGGPQQFIAFNSQRPVCGSERQIPSLIDVACMGRQHMFGRNILRIVVADRRTIERRHHAQRLQSSQHGISHSLQCRNAVLIDSEQHWLTGMQPLWLSGCRD
ncbi:MAG: hypothetical protein Q8Q81_16375 [Oxalobacteraceae bacterium]|nr:hypothetical protein [Oxalobacteraceae bacterium]